MGCFLEQSKNVTTAVNLSDFLPAVKVTDHHGDDDCHSVMAAFSPDALSCDLCQSHVTHVRYGLCGAFNLV